MIYQNVIYFWAREPIFIKIKIKHASLVVLRRGVPVIRLKNSEVREIPFTVCSNRDVKPQGRIQNHNDDNVCDLYEGICLVSRAPWNRCNIIRTPTM